MVHRLHFEFAAIEKGQFIALEGWLCSNMGAIHSQQHIIE
jgi:hypothetical protein